MTGTTPPKPKTAKRPDAHVPEQRSFVAQQFKALDGDGDAPGTFEAIVSVYGNVDSYGDVMQPGAFDDTLATRGLPPIVWSHDWQTPPIGLSLEAEDREFAGGVGLYVKGRLFVDVAGGEDHPVARMAWAAMRTPGGDDRPALREWSFGFRTKKASDVQVDVEDLEPKDAWTGGYLRHVEAVELYEVGPTLVGANDATATLGVKAALVEGIRRGALTTADLRSLLDDHARQDGIGNPAPNDDAPKAGTLSEEVRARLADLDALKPPLTL